MVRTHRNPFGRTSAGWGRVAAFLVAALVSGVEPAGTLCAQAPGVHYQHRADMPPGAIGTWQLKRGGPLPGYFQPVEIKAPSGAKISLASEAGFVPAEYAPLTVGMLIGGVYRLKVTNIPLAAGLEVFPTIEVIDRLYPPPGLARKFPIPVELTAEELRLAAEGQFVTRVIYVENPDDALPAPEDPDHQHWLDAGTGVDPLQMADLLGRPVAILRMGGRIPLEGQEGEREFLGCAAPWIRFPTTHIRTESLPAPPAQPRPLNSTSGLPTSGFDGIVGQANSGTRTASNGTRNVISGSRDTVLP